MGYRTNIDWTDHTWNPWQGCHKVSQGCEHCYMYREKTRYGQDPSTVVRSSRATFEKPLSWHRTVVAQARGGLVPKPELVFACSWSDFFVTEADPWRDEAWDIIRRTPYLTYQLLTKRVENIAARLPADWGAGWRNVWLVASAENQAAADERLPLLLQTPAAVRGVSVEPMLSGMDLTRYVFDRGKEIGRLMYGPAVYNREQAESVVCPSLDLVICGGESGPDARPMHSAWPRGLRDQCKAAGVPFWFKQWGEWLPGNQVRQDSAYWPGFVKAPFGTLGSDGQWLPDRYSQFYEQKMPAAECVYKVSKAKAGHLLDGERWQQLTEGMAR